MKYIDHNSKFSASTYRLRFVLHLISQTALQTHLSYYGLIDDMQEVDNLPAPQWEILCTFNPATNFRLLNSIWAVNVQGYNLSITKAHLTTTQLDYRKQHVAGFRGFNHRTTESQALRLFRPYGGMSGYFHQNIAYIAFKTYDQMMSACRLRLYTDDDRLITGKPRLIRSVPMQSVLQTPQDNS